MLRVSAVGSSRARALILLVLALLPEGSELGAEALGHPRRLCAVRPRAAWEPTGSDGSLALQVAAACGTLLVSTHVLLSTEGPSLAGEALYGWLALYAAYFFTTRQAAAQLALMSFAYLAVLIASVPAADVPGNWITLVAVIFRRGARARCARWREPARAQPDRIRALTR